MKTIENASVAGANCRAGVAALELLSGGAQVIVVASDMDSLRGTWERLGYDDLDECMVLNVAVFREDAVKAQDHEAIGAALEAGQAADPTADGGLKPAPRAGHIFIGMDFIPVTECLPNAGHEVLMAFEDGDCSIGFRDGGHWFYSDGVPVRQAPVTYWSELPEATHG